VKKNNILNYFKHAQNNIFNKGIFANSSFLSFLL